MRILSNSAKFHLLVQNEVRQHAQDAQGVLQGYVLKPQIMLEFTQSGITAYEYEFAFRHWGGANRFDLAGNRTTDAWGAHPDMNDGALGARIYRGWDPRLQFSVFDTDGIQGVEEKQAVEDYFTKYPSGDGWVTVVAEAIPAPWPTYDSMHHNKIGPTAHDLGLVAEALRYERATKNREAVIKALEKQHEAQIVEAEEDEALKVIVP